MKFIPYVAAFIALGVLVSLAQCIDRAAEVTRPMMPNPCHKER